MPAAAATHQESRHTTAHYRVVNGKVIFVHDYHANHAIASTSREALLHERSAIVSTRPNRIRSTNGADTRELQRIANMYGIRHTKTRAGGNHHGRQGAYDVLDFETPQDARAVLNAVAFRSGHSQEPPPPLVNTAPLNTAPARPARRRPATPRPVVPLATPAAAPVARTASAGPTAREFDDHFERIFGERIETPAPRDDEFNEQFETLFGKLGTIYTQNYTVSDADIARIKAAGDFQDRVQRGGDIIPAVRFTRTAMTMWNQHVKLDPAGAMADIYKHFGPGGNLSIEGQGDTMTINYTHENGTSITRYYSGLGTANAKVSHAFFSVPQGRQGNDNGKKLFANSIPFYEAIGVKKITVHANIDVGSYAWARYRFRPNDAGNLAIIKESMRMSGYYNRMMRSNPDFAAAMNSSALESAWVIVDAISKEIASGRMDKRENPLLNLHWHGHINLNDAAQMRAVREYISRGSA
jgi:hypothetical protein